MGKEVPLRFLSSEVYFSAAPSIVGEFQVPQFRVSAASPRKKLNRSSFFRNFAAVRAHAHSTRGQLAGSGRLIILSFRQLIRRPRKRNVATELRFCGMSPAEWPSVRPPLNEPSSGVATHLACALDETRLFSAPRRR